MIIAYKIHNIYYQSKGYNIYDIQYPLLEKELLINKYNLKKSGLTKEYWINNTKIISNQIRTTFNYINDLSVDYDNKTMVLFCKCERIECDPFIFYESDIEEEYILYEGNNNGVKIELKEYPKYFTLEYIVKVIKNKNYKIIVKNIIFYLVRVIYFYSVMFNKIKGFKFARDYIRCY